MAKYDFKKIESKWQRQWEKDGIYEAQDSGRKKWYSLIEFPYPSGDGLHIGHIRSNTAMDIISRKRRMEGYNVLYPIGWDAFGLPTENYAIKTGISPEAATKKNTDTFRRQLKSLGFSFDWSREVNTTDPEYYKWTQWMFLKFFENGLAYKDKVAINWCPSCKIGLANEEAVGGVCDRCGGPVEKKTKEQWMIRITEYADKLLEGLNDVDYIPQAKIQQENWIGRSEGVLLKFKLSGVDGDIEAFTTRPDTLFGATYLVVAPEHPLLASDKLPIINRQEIDNYIQKAIQKTDIERTEEKKEKTGVELKGIKAINPANDEEIPIWVADYVLASYGTGAIMAVPAHDERDFEFAQKFNLPIKTVIDSGSVSGGVYIGSGKLANSGKFDGMDSEAAKKAITEFVGGKTTVKYKLRDWVFSRQRYWGEPIPLVHCEKCALDNPAGQGWVAVPEEDLPVELPKVKKYQPTDTGESPLAAIEKWVNTKCPKCGGPAKRETDTMPNWAGSSWYFLRYCDPHNKKEFASNDNLKYFMPVDWYNGGMEHTVLHLLYSRFWNRFLYDLGFVPVAEPYKKRTSHGMILAEGGVKMSKSKGNVINPDDLVKEFGADALRLYEMFMGPFEQSIAWDPRGILGTSRFLEKVWKIGTDKLDDDVDGKDLERLAHKTVKKVAEDIESMAFNTAISAMMIFINECFSREKINQKIWTRFLLVLAPFAPHIAEELWGNLGNKTSIHLEPWPKFNSELIAEEEFELLIQVNGKLRSKILVASGISQEEAERSALSEPDVKKWIGDSQIKKIIFVEDRLINFIV
ncbi:MAG: leucine--tRNA ligase [bacterium]|nr:leucine--tRNA ligase [bacterium]